MATPILKYSAQRIAAWASQVTAPADLPRLVRRLLLATTRVTSLNMPVDEQVRRAGADGLVVVEGGNAFCPDGLSLWELSTRNDFTKLKEDFEKRSSANYPGVEPSRTTYVAVSARIIAPVAKAQFSALSPAPWKAVRLLDAEDLALWLESAPSVAAWFGPFLGAPVVDLVDIETCLEIWCARVDPPLPASVLQLGDERRRVERHLREWMASGRSRFYLQAANRAEALAFASAVFRKRDEDASRIVIVQSADALRWLKANHGDAPLVVLPDYDGFEPGQAGANHKLLVPTADRLPSTIDAAALEPLPVALLERELERTGVADAQRLAQESGGHIGALLRLLGHQDLPRWASGVPEPELVAMLLVGAWDPSNDADKEVAEALAGSGDVGQMCNFLAKAPECPLKFDPEDWGGRPIFAWASRSDAWTLLAPLLSYSPQLDQFFLLARQVLEADNPSFELDKEERYAAAIYGKTLRHSEYLREGLCGALLRLANAAADRDSSRARGLVRDLLEPTWVRWASLSDVLPTLAEAAPVQFLDQLDALLRNKKEVSEIFAQENTLGGAPHTGLLWALERLAWSRESLHWVVDVLARLAAVDPGGNLVNRPSRTLHAILHPLMPQSGSTAEERVNLTQRLLEQQGQVGWPLALAVLDDASGGIIFPTAKPEVRAGEWGVPVSPESAAPEECSKQLQETLRLVTEHVGSVEQRWVDVVSRMRRLPSTTRDELLESLATLARSGQFNVVEVWGTFREELHRSKFAKAPEVTAWLAAAYERLTPDNPLDAVAWLFRGFPHLPNEDTGTRYMDKAKLLTTERAAAVERLWESGHLPRALNQLASQVDAGWLGAAIAHGKYADEYEKLWLAGAQPVDLSAGFFARLGDDRGLPWMLGIIDTLWKATRFDEAVQCALRATPGSTTWTFVEQEAELGSKYWSQVGWIGREPTSSEVLHAVDKLVQYGRPLKALEVASDAVKTLSSADALQVLTRVADQIVTGAPPEQDTQMVSHHVEQLLHRVDDDADLQAKPEVLNIELLFLDSLHHSPRQPRALFRALNDPPFFAKMLELMYRPQSGTSDNDEPSEKQQNAARNAYRVLEAWNTYPGQGSSDPQEAAITLQQWAEEAINLGKESDRYNVTIVRVAEVLARPSAGQDGAWPSDAARALLEEGEHPDLASALSTAKRNMRGMVSKAMGEGGRQEHAIANRYSSDAEKLAPKYPRTAQLLRKLAEQYRIEAKREDERGEATRRQYSRAPRTFEERDEFEQAASDLYDEFAVATLIAYFHKPIAGVELRADPPASGLRIAVGWNHAELRRVEAGWVDDSVALKLSAEQLSGEVIYLDENASKEVKEWAQEALGYSPTIEGQIVGDWFESMPDQLRGAEPTYAVLFGEGGPGGEALLLRKIDSEWRPISNAEVKALPKIAESAVFIPLGDEALQPLVVQTVRAAPSDELAVAFPVVPQSRWRRQQTFMVAHLSPTART